jgi:hypothetical protein
LSRPTPFLLHGACKSVDIRRIIAGVTERPSLTF